MSGGRPRTVIGTFGAVTTLRIGTRRYRAWARYRDVDGKLRQVTATSHNANAAAAKLKQRLIDRPGFGRGGVLSLASPFGDLAELWLADLELRGIAANTKDNYRDDLRVHVRPFFENYSLGEITTSRVEWFLGSSHRRNVLSVIEGSGLLAPAAVVGALHVA